MTLQTTDELLNETNLIEFLKKNPDVFQRHPELLELVTLSDNRGTASLLEKQIEQLKQRLSKFQSQQFELIEVARENEQISDSFNNIICQLIAFNNLSEFASEFPVALRKTFKIDEVTFKTPQAVKGREVDQQAYSEALRRLNNREAVCDNRWPSTIAKLFFTDAIKSSALVPMRISTDSNPIGILALGSNEADRYNHELGTAHLGRLGIMAGLCISRLQPKES